MKKEVKAAKSKTRIVTRTTDSLRPNSARAGKAVKTEKAMRGQAEKISRGEMKQAPLDIAKMSPLQIKRAFHELRVHQIELKMQNEELQRSQYESKSSQERYFNLYNLAPVGYITVSERGLILESNLTAATVLGVTRSALENRLLSYFISKEDQEIYYQHRKKLVETVQVDKPQICELRMVKKDGTAFWAHLETTVTQDDKVAPVFHIALTEITDRKLFEGEKERNALRLGKLVDILQHPSETIQEFLDFALAKAIELTSSKIGYIYYYHEDRKEFVLNTWSKDVMAECTVASPQTCYELDKTGIWGEAVRQRKPIVINDFLAAHPLKKGYPKGHAKLFKFMTVPIFKNKSIVGVVGLANKATDYNETDILQVSLLMEAVWKVTDRKQAEDELKVSEERYRALFDRSIECAYVLDFAGNFLDANNAALNLFGYKREELPSLNLATLLSDDQMPLVRQTLKEFQDTGYQKNVTSYRLKNKNGDYVCLETMGSVLLREGNPYAILVTARDTTSRKRAEEERQGLEDRLQRAEKMESLGLLAGGVAHDLNNVLGIVVGYAELLLNGIDEKNPLRKDLVTIMEGGQKAAAIVDDMLALTRRGVVSRKVLNLNQLINDFKKSPGWEEMHYHHPAVQIKTDLEPDLLNISGSSVHLEKTLYNLVSNACEAMAKGGTLTIKTTNQYVEKPISGYDTIEKGDYVVLSVSDAGEGISANNLNRIFEPFYTKKIMGRSGTGLGLSVVWGTVKDHNGYIDVVSVEGNGSTFTLYFPVTRKDIADEALAISIAEYMGNGQSILVVDDVEEQRYLAVSILKLLNYNVSCVASGEEAVTYLKEHKADLLVLDMIMDPGMDGLDTYSSVLKMNPQQKVIIVSGFSESDRVHDAQIIGAGAYIKKPYVIERLGLAVKKELESKR